jgi:hypothetical protein
MGDTLLCVDPRTGKARWKKGVGELEKEKKPLLDSVLTPPALVNGKVFLGTCPDQAARQGVGGGYGEARQRRQQDSHCCAEADG